jgi:hypothetical protein
MDRVTEDEVTSTFAAQRRTDFAFSRHAEVESRVNGVVDFRLARACS